MRSWSSAVTVGLCLLLAPSISNAATIYACKLKIGGTIRIVGEKTVCLATETKVSWPDAAEITALKNQVAGLQTLVTSSQAQVAGLQDLLQHFTRNGTDISITGANLWVKSGSGTTHGTVNGLGNLIVGYNEERPSGDVRTGSHNLIVGKHHNYSSYGGVVAGYWNTVSGANSSVSGGGYNTASGESSTVSGGYTNTASGTYSSVSGGNGNTASANYSSVSGGASNIASGAFSAASGGARNTASGQASSVSGGEYNAASGHYSSVAGGRGGER